jgi:hypothetical protein
MNLGANVGQTLTTLECQVFDVLAGTNSRSGVVFRAFAMRAKMTTVTFRLPRSTWEM